MFGNFEVKAIAESLGHMTITLAQDFVGLPREIVSQKIKDSWRGATVSDGETLIKVTHPSIPYFTFNFIADVLPNSHVPRLIVEGESDYAEITLWANQRYVIAVGSPLSAKGLNKKAQKLLNILRDEFDIQHLPSLSEREKSALKGKFMMAAITASIIVAIADGELNFDERERLVDIVTAYKKDLASPQEKLKMIEMHVDEVEKLDDPSRLGVMHHITKDLLFVAKKMVLHAAGTMALSDGTFNDSEKKKISQISAAMGLNQSQLQEWVQEFDVTVKQAKIMGTLAMN